MGSHYSVKLISLRLCLGKLVFQLPDSLLIANRPVPEPVSLLPAGVPAVDGSALVDPLGLEALVALDPCCRQKRYPCTVTPRLTNPDGKATGVTVQIVTPVRPSMAPDRLGLNATRPAPTNVRLSHTLTGLLDWDQFHFSKRRCQEGLFTASSVNVQPQLSQCRNGRLPLPTPSACREASGGPIQRLPH